jgi:hypothetical protein
MEWNFQAVTAQFDITKQEKFVSGRFAIWNVSQNYNCLEQILCILLENRNTCMQRPLAYIVQTLFQHEVFVIITERRLALHAML